MYPERRSSEQQPMDRNAAADRSSGRLVIVDGIGAASHRWKDGLGEFRPEIVASIGEVQDLCARDVVIVDLPELGDETLASIRMSVRGTAAMALLTAAHHELAAILRLGVNHLFRHIVPRTGLATNVHALVAKLRTPEQGKEKEEARSQADVDGAISWAAAVELLQWTVSECVRVPGVIIRSHQPRSNKFELQLVFRLGRDFEHFHCELPRRWRWPARRRAGEVFTRVEGTDPSVQSFGEVERDQEIFARPLADSGDRAYLAVLPWAKDERVTVALGLWLEDSEANVTKDAGARVISELHAQAVREVAQLTVPTLDDTTKGVRYLLEYNWVVTRRYAGPDRRNKDTSVINRYMFVGRRKTLARSVEEKAAGFVDGVPSWLGPYFVAYAVLATIDTFCTSRFVSAGRVIELNPLLSPLITQHPWLFLVTKNVFAVAAFAIIVRFHRFRHAKHVLRAGVGAYALLDVYWAILLLGPLCAMLSLNRAPQEVRPRTVLMTSDSLGALHRARAGRWRPDGTAGSWSEVASPLVAGGGDCGGVPRGIVRYPEGRVRRVSR